MKKHSFGMMLFLVGNDLLVPYIIFCAFGIIGLVICVFETFFRQKWDARRKQEHTGQLRDLSKKIL